MSTLKTHKSLHEQALLLSQRGLEISDLSIVENTLLNVNYYRISGYLHDYKQEGSDCYQDGLTWEWLKSIYDFDRKLNRLMMFALEDIEGTFKSRLSYALTSSHPQDPLIYLNRAIYRNESLFQRFVSDFQGKKQRNSGLPFVQHHYTKYQGDMPMWVAVELFTMGNLHAIYDNLLPMYQKTIARYYRTGVRQLSSWIQNLTYTRNHLAHNMRIYNYNFGRTPAKCQNHPAFLSATNMIFDQVFVIACMYSDPYEWVHYVIPEIERLFDEYAGLISIDCLGFPEDWIEILSNPTVKPSEDLAVQL